MFFYIIEYIYDYSVLNFATNFPFEVNNQTICIKWVLVSLTGKVFNGWIRDLRFVPYLH